MEDATQTEGTGQVDWRMYDTNKALRNLASTSSRVRLLTLRRLHVRWHHPNDQQPRPSNIRRIQNELYSA
eukprot:2346114-Amphidinium_carterae.1